MARCSFCGRTFASAQGVRAHLKTCPAYRRTRPSRPAPRRNQMREDERQLDRLCASAGASVPSPRASVSDVPESRPMPRPGARPSQNHAVEDLRRHQQAREEAQRRAEAARHERATRIRALVQQVQLLVVDLHFSVPPVPSAAIAEAKVAIERELIQLPLLELPLTELQQIATGLRDKIYATFRTTPASVPAPSTSVITPTPNHLSPKEATMPMRKVLSGYFECPLCEEEYELDRVPEPEAVCEECHVKLEEVDEEDNDGE